ncbi:hypothetical protein L916_02907 [Phytophthora nicotianae]|uniref:Uncharacterized protein n=2 Tax=Phytophthora nicotianae TaxID=4792 RepID=W2JNX4_PHYNI|nr:hypothetical protein L916_02907 [Phytophthora nicotianae]ETO82787.1 hypothetical protein F444_03106 [Phytophthora nicotianae P1976]
MTPNRRHSGDIVTYMYMYAGSGSSPELLPADGFQTSLCDF